MHTSLYVKIYHSLEILFLGPFHRFLRALALQYSEYSNSCANALYCQLLAAQVAWL